MENSSVPAPARGGSIFLEGAPIYPITNTQNGISSGSASGRTECNVSEGYGRVCGGDDDLIGDDGGNVSKKLNNKN